MKKSWNNQYVKAAAFIIAGLLIGWFINPSVKEKQQTTESKEQEKSQIWTCSMHPQIRQDKPGKCPICGMDLIPLKLAQKEMSAGENHVAPSAIQMSEDVMKLAEIQTEKVKKIIPKKSFYLYGDIQPDETKLFTQTAHFPGRIEKLFVNFTGEKVSKGQKLALIYSPPLITAQKELLEAVKTKDEYPALYQAARNKLKLWKLRDEQIEAIEKSGKVHENIELLADYDGYVWKRFVETGDHLKEGGEMFLIADISNVWAIAEAYGKDLPFLSLGDEFNFSSESVPGQKFKGKVTYINPFVDEKKRIAEVRIDIPNPQKKLLPGMYVSALVEAKTKYKSPQIVVPKSAVLWTGKRSIVYVKDTTLKHPTFYLREIELGENLGEYYIVKSGLQEGEEIAVHGVFRIDAAAQLSGKKSMMNPEGGKMPAGHHHGAGLKSEGHGENQPKD